MPLIVKQPITLLEALVQLCPESSKNRLRHFVEEGRALVDGDAVTRSNAQLSPGQVVSLSEHKSKYIDNLKVVYEDEHLVVIDKPSGLLSVASNFEKQETVHSYLKKHYSPRKIFVIHRLDFETSGLMIFAKTFAAYETLKEQLAKREISRIYYGVVEGLLEGKGSWSCYLQEDAAYYVHASDNPEMGELAITHFEAMDCSPKYSLICFILETGKKNQIRVQAARAGHPLVGDEKYGAKTNKMGRIALHAGKLSFSHPITQKALSFSSPIPSSFTSLFPK